ncbi:uncharacterized protein LOC115545448 isoform X2 [Gadus morhua]|uniref:uncharacterized protein LOC115545448 isoform X2 n=1 Tax=Gadus morhua TaxID=8049 RepID=UPI0011B3A1BB|nr:uncharacterized protein LOC115545448 isoform X2 [Gadus morhua]
MDSKSIKSKPKKLMRGVCRLCGDDFSSLKDRCDLVPSTGKPLFTLALEDITGPVSSEDDLTAVCVRCKQHLTRYYKHKTDVERRGTAIRDMAAKSVFTKKKRGAPATDIAPKPPRKKTKYSTRRGGAQRQVAATLSIATPAAPGCPGATTTQKSTLMDTDQSKAIRSPPKPLPVLWSLRDVKAAVGKVSQKDADGASKATSTNVPGDQPATVSLLTAPPESSISSPSAQPVQQLVTRKDADGVSMETSTTAPQFSSNTVYLANALPEPPLSAASVQDNVDGTKATASTPKKLPVLWSLRDVQAAVGKVLQKDAGGVSPATSIAEPGTLPAGVSLLTASPVSPLSAPSTQSVQEDTVGTTAREFSVHPPPKIHDTGTGQRSTARIIVTTPKWKHSRIITGPLERVADALVRAEHYRLPRCLMKIPGMDNIMIDEVLKRVKDEAIKLTSVRFGSVLRQTTQDALDKFDLSDVVSEWKANAPTFLKFLECVSSASFDGLPSSESSYTKTKKGATVMGGATLLRARVHQMNAMQHRNSLLLRQGGTNKRCLARLSRLGCCVSSKRKMATKKTNVIHTVNHIGEGQESEVVLHEQSLAGEQEHSADGPQPGVQEHPPSEATSLEALLGLEESGGDQEHTGPQQGVQELSASEVTSLEALLGLEEGGGDQEHSAAGPQPGVQELPPSEATSLEALLGLEEGGGDQTTVPSSVDEQVHKKTTTD